MARKARSDNPLERQKAFAQRVDHQYFERRHPWRVWKRRLGWGLPLIGLAVFCAFALRPGGETLFMPGHVSMQHAPFEQRCEECHERQGGNWGAVLDSKCLACHDAPVHSIHTVHTSGNVQKQFVKGKLVDVNTPGCVSCHSEHHGQVRLAAVDNSRCLQCHVDLKRSDGKAPTVVASIRDFDVTHPDWRVLREGNPDDTPFRLNHKLHCDPDQVTWPAEIAEAAKKNQSLLCAQCHEPDQNRTYFKPINYAAHCASCHGMEKFAPAIEPVGKLSITHGDPKRVAAEVTSQVATYLARHGGTPALLNAAEPAKGGDDDDEKPKKNAAPADNRTAEQWIHDTTRQALQPLFFPAKVEKEAKSCLKCHVGGSMDESGLLQISPKKIPVVWLKQAHFDHHAHGTVACVSCHKTATQSQFTTDVMLPDITSCRVCHSKPGGAKTDCVECHRYHDRELSIFKAGRSVEALSVGGAKSRYARIRSNEENEAVNRELTDAESLRLEELMSKRASWDTTQQKELVKRAEEQRAKEKALAERAKPDKTQPDKPVTPVTPPVIPEPVKSVIQKPLPAGKVTCPNCKKEWPGDAKFCGRCGIKVLKGE